MTHVDAGRNFGARMIGVSRQLAVTFDVIPHSLIVDGTVGKVIGLGSLPEGADVIPAASPGIFLRLAKGQCQITPS
jgi:hypothetical protein